MTLQTVWKERDRIAKPEDPRPIDVMADGAMGRLHGRLGDYAGLPADRFPLAARAQGILDTLFPDGLAFLTTDFASQWSETKKKLQRIDEEGLAKDARAPITRPRSRAPLRTRTLPARGE